MVYNDPIIIGYFRLSQQKPIFMQVTQTQKYSKNELSQNIGSSGTVNQGVVGSGHPEAH